MFSVVNGKKNREEKFFPTRDGISLKLKEWEDMLKFANQMFGERLELFQCTPCLIDPNQSNHDPLTCIECSHLNFEAKGEVSIDIPL